MRKVLFLGTFSYPSEIASAEVLERDVPDDAEIWVVNEAHWSLPEGWKADRVFQLHVRDWREGERRYKHSNGKDLPPNCDPDCFGRNNAHVEYLRTCGVPVYGQKVWDDIPTSTRYPFEVATEEVGIALPPYGKKRLWATSSFGYMAALLLTEHKLGAPVSDLYLYGVELPLGSNREKLWEWPNFAYYLGLAAGLGITIHLPSTGSALLSAPHYALDGNPYPGAADHWDWVGYPSVVEDGDVLRLGTYVPQPIVEKMEVVTP